MNSTCVVLSLSILRKDAVDKTGQPCVLEHGEDPGVIDAGIGSSKVCH